MRWLNLGTKVTLAGLLLLYALRPELEQFGGKVMPLRAALFPVAAALVGLLWLCRGRPRPYPHLPDALVTLATVVDFGGNAAGFYRYEYFDHGVHFVNMAILATAFGLLIANTVAPRWAKAGLVLGFGAVLHTIWEISEYWLAEAYGAALDVRAVTTIWDFTAGLIGTTIAATLTYLWLWDRVDLGGRVFGSARDGSSRPEGRPHARR